MRNFFSLYGLVTQKKFAKIFDFLTCV